MNRLKLNDVDKSHDNPACGPSKHCNTDLCSCASMEIRLSTVVHKLFVQSTSDIPIQKSQLSNVACTAGFVAAVHEDQTILSPQEAGGGA